MKLALLALVAACHAATDDYPIGPGGSPGGSTRGGDAGVSDATDGGASDAGVQISGRVCVVTDLRDPTACPDVTVRGGLTVSIGGTRTAVPNARGEFTIFAPPGPFTWRVTGTQIVTSVVPFGADVRLPVIDLEAYLELLSNNGVARIELQGAVAMRVVKANVPVASVTAVSNPATPDVARYDDEDSAVDWRADLLGTGPRGMVWLPDIPLTAAAITATVRLTPPGATPLDTQVPVADDAITFVTVELP